jgi:hypothetical protein
MTFPSPLFRPFLTFPFIHFRRLHASLNHVFLFSSRPVFPPCVLPSVVICFHVFTVSFFGLYITCIAVYHVHQSEYRLGSVPSTSRLAPRPRSPFAPALPTQAPRLTVKLSGSPFLLAPCPFLLVPLGQKPNRFLCGTPCCNRAPCSAQS